MNLRDYLLAPDLTDGECTVYDCGTLPDGALIARIHAAGGSVHMDEAPDGTLTVELRLPAGHEDLAREVAEALCGGGRG